MKSKKKIIIVIAVVLVILCIPLAMYLSWHSYMNKVWEPLIEINESREVFDENWYKVYDDENEYQYYYVASPEIFEYQGNLGISDFPPFDPNDSNDQFGYTLMIRPEKDGSGYTWKFACDQIGRQSITTTITGTFEYEIDPSTGEPLNEELTDEQLEFYNLHKEKALELIADAKSFWSPYL